MRSAEGTAAQMTQLLIGRARELAELTALVASQPLFALVGAAGVGKSALVRAALPEALVASARGGEDALASAWRSEAGVVVWDDAQELAATAELVARLGARAGDGRLVIVSRQAVAGVVSMMVSPLSAEDCRALVAALDARAAVPLYARIAALAGGNPAEATRRLADLARAGGDDAARAALAERSALDALCAGRFGDALEGDPIVAAFALAALDALDRADALLRAHSGHPWAPLVELALACRRGELRDCVARGETLLRALGHGGDGLGEAVAAAIVARAAFGLGEIARAEALVRRVDGYVAASKAQALAPLADLAAMLIAAFRGDWAEARRRVAHAAEIAPAATLCRVERSWADSAVPQEPAAPLDTAALDDAARALHDVRAAERALSDGRLDAANRHAREAERFWRSAGATYDRALALVARAEALARSGEREPAGKLTQACVALADAGGYRIVRVAAQLVDAYSADRGGDLERYIAALATARDSAGSELAGRALGDACARVGLARPTVVAEGQPLRDRVARLGLARPAELLCSVGAELYLLADDDALPAADAVARLDDGALTAGRREWPVAPQLVALLAAIAEAGPAGLTPEQLYLAVWDAADYHALRHRNAVYVAVNRLRAALEPFAGKDAVRSTATHYALAPGLRIALVREVKQLRTGERPSRAQARWQAALRAAEKS